MSFFFYWAPSSYCLDFIGDDTKTNVERLCYKAAQPIHEDITKELGIEGLGIQVGSVCVYPSCVGYARACLDRIGASHIPVTAGKAHACHNPDPVHFSAIFYFLIQLRILLGRCFPIFIEGEHYHISCGSSRHCHQLLLTFTC